MLSTRGRCHTFDARADGYVRGEGCYSMLLRSADDVEKAVFEGAAVQQDGKSASLTAPNGQAQRQLIRAALADASLLESDLFGYEAHGTGTPLGDPVEIRALEASVLVRRGGGRPLAIGSSKANWGHAEAAAGACGLVCLGLRLMAEQAPPNAQLRIMNVHVVETIAGSPGVMPVQLLSLASRQTPRHAGSVSSFGLNGTIAHGVMSRSWRDVK
eukprot:scaffold329498_cov59-Tisochrysis_lutea.AAC.1